MERKKVVLYSLMIVVLLGFILANRLKERFQTQCPGIYLHKCINDPVCQCPSGDKNVGETAAVAPPYEGNQDYITICSKN